MWPSLIFRVAHFGQYLISATRYHKQRLLQDPDGTLRTVRSDCRLA